MFIQRSLKKFGNTLMPRMSCSHGTWVENSTRQTSTQH